MKNLRYSWKSEAAVHTLEMVLAQGTNGESFLFGEGPAKQPMQTRDFYLATVPVTQALWKHVMGTDANPACHRGDLLPLENVSWNEIALPGGFLDRINASAVLAEIAKQSPSASRASFRLPSEVEWEYAARGGRHWTDLSPYSGGDDIDKVAWYKDNSGDQTHEVARKAANPLGIYDMSGNVWEWCQDCYTPDVSRIPADGSPFVNEDERRVLRGGCFHNWAVHCTATKRYEIGGQYGDGCIGFRLALSVS
jgi:formylglycine-generating enzyme required for sulfatase activity